MDQKILEHYLADIERAKTNLKLETDFYKFTKDSNDATLDLISAHQEAILNMKEVFINTKINDIEKVTILSTIKIYDALIKKYQLEYDYKLKDLEYRRNVILSKMSHSLKVAQENHDNYIRSCKIENS